MDCMVVKRAFAYIAFLFPTADIFDRNFERSVLLPLVSAGFTLFALVVLACIEAFNIKIKWFFCLIIDS